MFCPECKAEYRQGFTRCSDCDVALVPSLAGENTDAEPMPTGRLDLLWEDENLALHTSLLARLDAGGIRYFTRPLGVFPGARRFDPFPIQPMTRFGYQVAVLSSQLASAREILEKLNEEPKNMELPEHDDLPDAAPSPVSADEEPTSEIWSGDDENLAAFLQDALRENEIAVHAEAGSSGNRICVRPSDVRRASEVVREVVEGAPPK